MRRTALILLAAACRGTSVPNRATVSNTLGASGHVKLTKVDLKAGRNLEGSST